MLLQILKKLSFLLCAVALLNFTACSGDEPINENSENTPSKTVKEPPRSLPNLNDSDAETKSEESKKKEDLKINTESINTIGGTGKVNPPHGQPGHVCEIPVGDPLPSGASSTVNTPIIKQPQPINNGVVLNPPHGEPGHKCEIPVGEPLN